MYQSGNPLAAVLGSPIVTGDTRGQEHPLAGVTALGPGTFQDT